MNLLLVGAMVGSCMAQKAVQWSLLTYKCAAAVAVAADEMQSAELWP